MSAPPTRSFVPRFSLLQQELTETNLYEDGKAYEMTVKGFLLEDDQGKELVMVCEKPRTASWKTFALRGWQRQRLVPLRCTELELRRVVGAVVSTLRDLFVDSRVGWGK